MHEILARLIREETTPWKERADYIANFKTIVPLTFPSAKVGDGFYNQGLDCIGRFEPVDGEVVMVEEKLQFQIGGHNFTGIIDLLYRSPEGELILCDHKSHRLRPRSKRHVTSSLKLDNYQRQLYLYVEAIKQCRGLTVDKIEFHLYRFGEYITEVVDAQRLETTKLWATGLIDRIRDETDWEASPDWYGCRYLCGIPNCEYSR